MRFDSAGYFMISSESHVKKTIELIEESSVN